MSKIKCSTHFWALMSEMLVVVLKDKKGLCYVCGEWEFSVDESELQFIEYINPPTNVANVKMYYDY